MGIHSFLSVHHQLWQRRFSFFLYVVVSFSTAATPTLSRKTLSTTDISSNGIVLKLVPGGSIHPPTYPQNSTALSKVVPPGNNAFYVSFSIGTQRNPQLATLDTASPYLWVQCSGYQHGHQTMNPVYDPSVSASYIPTSCVSPDDSQCKEVFRGQCDGENRCTYNMTFRNQDSYSTGFLGYEDLTFFYPDSPRIPYVVRQVMFGCGDTNYDQDQAEDGVFGLAGSPLSILNQQDGKFSVCFGGITDPSSESHLAFFDKAKFLGVPVPFLGKNGKYEVLLESIFIGEDQRVIFPPFGVVIDTGSTLSIIRQEIYIQIRTYVEDLIGTKMNKVQSGIFPDGLCYKAPEIITDFPNVTIRFGKYTALLLDIRGMFWKTPGENLFCLAFKPTPTDEDNVIGIVNLQFHNVAFKWQSKEAYFLRIEDCNKI